MIKYLLPTLLFLSIQTAFAQQGKLGVSIQQEGFVPRLMVNIELVNQKTNRVEATKTGDSMVVFDVGHHTAYLLKLTGVGIQQMQQKVTTGNDSTSISFELKRSAKTMDAVVVVARKPFIRQEEDKTIVDAEPIANTSSNAYEVIEKIPGAIMLDGNVYLNSTSPAIIQINGREVKMSAQDVSTLLKNLPANSVVRVEVLRTPSAKYDAASTGGIVNIVLKKGVRLGLNGNVNAEYSQGKYARQGAGFSLNNGAGKTKTSLSYQFNNRKDFTELKSSRLLNQSTMEQNAYTLSPGQTHFISTGIDYEFNKKWSASYNTRLSLGNNQSLADNITSLIAKDSANPSFIVDGFTDNESKNFNWDHNADLNLNIDTLGSKWENRLGYNYNRSRGLQDYGNIYEKPALPALYGNGESIGRRNFVSLQTDLTWKKIKTLTFETGGKWTSNHFTNDADFVIRRNGTKITDREKSAQFNYAEGIGAAYLLAGKTFGKLFVKPGVRLEYTQISGQQLFPSDTSFSIERTDIFPNFFIRYPLFKLFGFEMKANGIFRRSITRPGYGSLNPTPQYIDQFAYNIGNPRLKPQFTTNYEMNVVAGEYPVITIGTNNIRDIFTSVTYEDTATNIIYTTYDNLGRNKELYLRGMAGIPPGGKYFFAIVGQYNYNRYTGFYQGKPMDLTNKTFSFFTFHNLKLHPNTTFNLFGFVRTGSMFDFYRLRSFGMLNLSLNQEVMKKKGNIIISWNDVFKTMQFRFKMNQGTINAIGERRSDYSRGTIKFIYNFGIKPKQNNGGGMFDMPTNPVTP